MGLVEALLLSMRTIMTLTSAGDMNGMTSNAERPRGRPRSERRGDIPDELIRALREVLAHKPPDAVTLREIAASAGTSPEMVRYYFNGKDGLIAALLDESLARVRARLAAMSTTLAEAEHGHSRIIVESLWSLYFDEREAGKLFNSEFVRTRARTRDIERQRRPDTIVEVLHEQISGLMARGVYRSTLDPARAAILIMSLTGCPVRLLETMSPRWINEETLHDPQWVDDVAAMVDALCIA